MGAAQESWEGREEMIYEGFVQAKDTYWVSVSQCAWCNSIKVWRWYIHLPNVKKITYQQSFQLPFGATVSITTTHGLCPSCAEKLCGPGFKL